MGSWDLQSDKGEYATGIKANSADEALKQAFPEFKWVAGVRMWDRHSFTMMYSGPAGWVQVVEY